MPRGTGKKWKTTRRDQESQEQAQEVQKEFSVQRTAETTDRAGHLGKAQTDQEERSEKVVTDHADHLEKVLTVREEISERTVSSETTGHVVHSVKDLTDRAGRSERAQTDHADRSERVPTDRVVRSVKAATVQEEVSATEEAPDSEGQPRRA